MHRLGLYRFGRLCLHRYQIRINSQHIYQCLQIAFFSLEKSNLHTETYAPNLLRYLIYNTPEVEKGHVDDEGKEEHRKSYLNVLHEFPR